MSSKTKIVVLHLKELIYTGIFVGLGILFIILLVIMFLPRKEKTSSAGSGDATESTPSPETTETSYIPGVYATSIVLSDHSVDVEVTVDSDRISCVRLVNLDEAVTTMYPLLAPSFDAIAEQLYATQSVENISYSEENKYTTLVLLEAIKTSLDKATVTLDIEFP